jgi:hypothetical protein
MSRFNQALLALTAIFLVGTTSGCMTPIGYSYEDDANVLYSGLVTVIKVERVKIYDATALTLVGPLAGAKATGIKYTFIDVLGETHAVLQPSNEKYLLRVLDKARFIVVRGQVWVQPIEYPLPPEFGMSNTSSVSQSLSSAGNPPLPGNVHIASKPIFKPILTDGWINQPLPDAFKAAGATVYALNGNFIGGLVYLPKKRAGVSDFRMFAEGRRAIQATSLKNAVKSDVRYFKINRHKGACFEVTGETNGQIFTYYQIIVEAEDEFRVLNMWALVGNFASAKPSFEVFAKQLWQ